MGARNGPWKSQEKYVLNSQEMLVGYTLNKDFCFIPICTPVSSSGSHYTPSLACFYFFHGYARVTHALGLFVVSSIFQW